MRSEHGWTIDVQADSAQIFVGTHEAHSGTNDDDSGVLDSDETYEQYYGVREPILDVFVVTVLFAWLDIER